MKKDFIKVNYPKVKLIIGIILLAILLLSVLINNTTMMREYTVNMLVGVVLKNYLNIIFLSILLIGMNLLQISIIRKSLKQKEGN